MPIATHDNQSYVSYVIQSYFTDGEYPNNETLLRLAQNVGLDVNECQQVLNSDEKIAAAAEKARAWALKGVTGE